MLKDLTQIKKQVVFFQTIMHKMFETNLQKRVK